MENLVERPTTNLMEELREYLYVKRMNITEFSEIVGYSRNHISGVMNKKKACGRKLAKKIEDATQGQIKAREIMFTTGKFR